MLPPIAVILPAAGKSSRFGGREKKPFTNLDGRAVWLRTAELFVNRPEVKQILIVVSPEDMEMFKRRFAANVMFMNIQIVEGGAERFESVENALAKLAPEIAYVAIHDSVRPTVPSASIDAVFQTAVQFGAAILALPIAETIKRVGDGPRVVESTISRKGHWIAQTPQVFRKEWILEAFAKRIEIKEPITDDSQLVEALGKRIQVVPGSPFNQKITTQDDLEMVELFIKNRRVEAPKASRPFDEDWMK